MEAVTECQYQGRSLNATSAVKTRETAEIAHQRQQDTRNSKNMGEEEVLLMGDNEMKEAKVYYKL